MSKSANKQPLARTLSFCSLILSILWSCSNNKKNHNTNDNNKPEIIYDTIDFTNQPPVNVQRDTNLNIEGNIYHLSYSVITDYVYPIKTNDTITEKSTMYINTYIGDNTKFRIVLTETNGLVIFDKTYHKYHFLSKSVPLTLVASAPQLPKFIGYNDVQDLFLFEITNGKPESDIMDTYLATFSPEGQLMHYLPLKSTGGSGADSEIQLASNSGLVLCNDNLINANRKVIPIAQTKEPLIGSRLLNDSAILIIHQYNDSSKLNNAFIVNPENKVLQSFVYRGYYEELDYNIPFTTEKSGTVHFLADEQADSLYVFNKLKSNRFESFVLSSVAVSIGSDFNNAAAITVPCEKNRYAFYYNNATKNFIIVDKK